MYLWDIALDRGVKGTRSMQFLDTLNRRWIGNGVSILFLLKRSFTVTSAMTHPDKFYIITNLHELHANALTLQVGYRGKVLLGEREYN